MERGGLIRVYCGPLVAPGGGLEWGCLDLSKSKLFVIGLFPWTIGVPVEESSGVASGGRSGCLYGFVLGERS